MKGTDSMTDPTDDPPDQSAWTGHYRRWTALAVVLAVFILAMTTSRLGRESVAAVITIGDPGTVSRLLVGAFTLQLVGFGLGATIVLWRRDDPLAFLRLGPFGQWTIFYGAAVGLGLMLVTVVATGVFNVLDIEPAEAAVGAAEDPSFYFILFVVSTFLTVPMEELFFRGILQRSLETAWHPGVAIVVPSLLFVVIHTTVTVGSGGQVVVMALFFSMSLLLGTSYYLTENLFVPIIGHAIFNGVQILIRGLEVATGA